VELEKFLAGAEAERVRRTLGILAHCGFSQLVLTGGFAVELHCLRRGFAPQLRPLNDIDFLAGSFAEIPRGLSAKMVFRHVHPNDPPNRTLLQCVDAETAIRVDAFRASGDTMARAIPSEIDGFSLRLISIEDLTARIARLCMDLADNTPIPAKHAQDFLRLLPLAAPDNVVCAWEEHRKAKHPKSFRTAASLLTDLIATRTDLQIVLQYSRDADRSCQRCVATPDFPLARAERMLSLLGYC
jgi:hypothetical protein